MIAPIVTDEVLKDFTGALRDWLMIDVPRIFAKAKERGHVHGDRTYLDWDEWREFFAAAVKRDALRIPTPENPIEPRTMYEETLLGHYYEARAARGNGMTAIGYLQDCQVRLEYERMERNRKGEPKARPSAEQRRQQKREPAREPGYGARELGLSDEFLEGLPT